MAAVFLLLKGQDNEIKTILIYFNQRNILGGTIIKQTRGLVILISIIVVGVGIWYILSMPLVSEEEAIAISREYVKEDFIMENAYMIDIENNDLEWVKRQEGFTGRYLWNIRFHDKDRNKVTSLSIDGRTGQLFDGEIVDTKTGKVERKFGEPGIIGYVVKKEGRQILVVNPVPQDFSSTGGVKEFYDAIWFSHSPRNVQIGQKVKVWFDFVATSYPGQSSAKRVLVLPSPKPDGANLSQAEAIRYALKTEGINNKSVPVIKTVNYNEQIDVWNIHIKQGEDELNIQVEDE